MKMFVENKIYNTRFGDIVPLSTANGLVTNITIVYKWECGRLASRTVPLSKNDHPIKTIIVYKTDDHYDACLPGLSARGKSVDQRPVTTFPLAEGLCNINLLINVAGVLTYMNCTLTA